MESLIVPGKLDSLSRIATFVTEQAAQAGLEKRAAYRLRLAVDEIATNIVTYGYEPAGIEADIEVQATIDDRALTVVLEDSAQPFDPRQHMLLDDLNAPLETRHVGGLGIYLALNGIDKFIYERVNGRNRNTFVVNRSS